MHNTYQCNEGARSTQREQDRLRERLSTSSGERDAGGGMREAEGRLGSVLLSVWTIFCSCSSTHCLRHEEYSITPLLSYDVLCVIKNGARPSFDIFETD